MKFDIATIIVVLTCPAALYAQPWENDIAAIRSRHISKILRYDDIARHDSAVHYYKLLPDGGLEQTFIWHGDTTIYMYDSLNRVLSSHSRDSRWTNSYSWDSVNRILLTESTSIFGLRLGSRVRIDTSYDYTSEQFDKEGNRIRYSSSDEKDEVDPKTGNRHFITLSDGEPSSETWLHCDVLGRDSDGLSIDLTPYRDTSASSWHRIYFHDPIHHTRISIDTVKDPHGRLLGVERWDTDSTTGTSKSTFITKYDTTITWDTVSADGVNQSGSDGKLSWRMFLTRDGSRYVTETYVHGELANRHEYVYEFDLR